jgi:NADH-quinone oxidoreductase subunit L
MWLIPALPLAGFVLLLIFGRRLGEPASGWVATFFCSAAFVVTVGVFINTLQQPADQRSTVTTLFTWIPVGRLHVDMGFLADPLSITMALFITGVSALIHLYAIGYMHRDAKFSKFFLYLNLFVFAMLMLVLGDNLLVTFLGWEGVGACSYFLISFWHTRNTAAKAGTKAFVTNRIGDWGFMLAMFLAFSTIGTLNYSGIIAAAPSLSTTTVTALVLLLFVGAVGKSAQLPLYVWLPDAMEGPTPVSALIHAATMVTAGVYLMCRISPLLSEVPDAGTVIAIVGAVTALFAATIAVAQKDIKKVLAYSTVSQLGYMFLAVGSGAYVAAIFHMITHAFFKALLFLGAGSVIHGMHGEQDMRFMGALRKVMVITAGTFIVGWLAIAGIPPLAGFWSKDDILLYASQKSWILWAIGFVTALLTAYYMTRQVILVFFTDERWNDARPEHPAEGEYHADVHGELHPHESPVLMLLPLVVLAGLAVIGGFLNLPFSRTTKYLDRWLEPVLGPAQTQINVAGSFQVGMVAITTLVAIGGAVLAYVVYQRRKLRAFEPAILENGWYVNAAYSWFIGGPGRQAFEAVAWFDKHVVDGAVEGLGGGARWLGGQLRKVQSGYVRNYAVGIAAGAVLLMVWFLSRSAF